MANLRTLAERQSEQIRFGSGHSMCRGCGIPIVVRTVLASIRTPVAVINATGCLEVASTRYPITAWSVPWLHVAFENAAAVASGVESAYTALRRRGALRHDFTIVVFAGDGGTYDIGLQALSGALERGHRFLYVCYDNEGYMNTGVQRSGATPMAASTTTTPMGATSVGKAEARKNLTEIVLAHHIPYVAQAAISHVQDLSDKVERAMRAQAPAFLNVLSACPPGWGHEPQDSINVILHAVNSAFWPLLEVIDGHWRLTNHPEPREPVDDWFRSQKRFAHLFSARDFDLLESLEEGTEAEWNRLLGLEARDREWFLSPAGRAWDLLHG
jgi:pyruvate ferredoxin oxidoreductase beta subunit